MNPIQNVLFVEVAPAKSLLRYSRNIWKNETKKEFKHCKLRNFAIARKHEERRDEDAQKRFESKRFEIEEKQ